MRRSATEWTQIVAAFHESGLSLQDFAASRGLTASRLRWWRWHLGAARSPPPPPPDELRLVPVVVEPSMPPPSAPAWEVCTSRGDVLRVYRAVAPAEIQAALSALLPRGGRP
jgi:hypothetical protein